MKFKFLSILLILLASFFASPIKTLATSPESLLVDVVPPNPAPYENVKITLSSYASNLDSVLITWSANGKTASAGIGQKSFSLTAPAAGSETNVTVTVSLPDGDIQKIIIIRPAVMTLLWQADDSYVPPFYRGKALPTAGSDVRVVAIPEIKTASGLVDPNNMTYAWKKDYTNDQSGSGYGRDYFTYTNDYLEGANYIEVTASTIDGNYSSQTGINIGTVQPEILFYRNDNKLGTIWEEALGNPHKINGEEVVQAEPFFISPAQIQTSILTWSWFINDNPVSVQYPKNVMPLKAQSGVSGTSNLRVQIDNRYKIFETASQEISIQF